MFADTRTNAGVDNISTFRKLHVFGVPGQRIMALASSGNLSLSQSVVSTLTEGIENPKTGEVETLLNAPTLFQAAQRIGHAIRDVHDKEAAALKAADELASENISAEVIDLRTLKPMDIETVVESVKKTGRLVTVEEGWRQSGVGAEIAARMMEEAFDYLDAPVARVSGKDVPMPYAANLEKLALPSVAEVVEAAKAVCYR